MRREEASREGGLEMSMGEGGLEAGNARKRGEADVDSASKQTENHRVSRSESSRFTPNEST
jgi:hypothetical protein